MTNTHTHTHSGYSYVLSFVDADIFRMDQRFKMVNAEGSGWERQHKLQRKTQRNVQTGMLL